MPEQSISVARQVHKYGITDLAIAVLVFVYDRSGQQGDKIK